jgi:hypothetical protein
MDCAKLIKCVNEWFDEVAANGQLDEYLRKRSPSPARLPAPPPPLGLRHLNRRAPQPSSVLASLDFVPRNLLQEPPQLPPPMVRGADRALPVARSGGSQAGTAFVATAVAREAREDGFGTTVFVCKAYVGSRQLSVGWFAEHADAETCTGGTFAAGLPNRWQLCPQPRLPADGPGRGAVKDRRGEYLGGTTPSSRAVWRAATCKNGGLCRATIRLTVTAVINFWSELALNDTPSILSACGSPYRCR